MLWKVRLSNKAIKNIGKLPKKINKILQVLLAELKIYGPYRANWQNYGKLAESVYHCHLKKGNPTFVALWKIIDKKRKCVEVIYVGTHEKADYDQLH